MRPDDKKPNRNPPPTADAEPLLGSDDDLHEIDAFQPFEGEAPSQETSVVSLADFGLPTKPTKPAAPPSGSLAGAQIEPLPPEIKVVLEFKSGPAATRLAKTVTVIGRAQGVADVAVPDDGQVSRQHAAVVFADGAFFLEDLESRNGTFLRGERIKRVKLDTLAEFSFGSYVARLRKLK